MRGAILDFDSLGPSDLDLAKLYDLPVDWEVSHYCDPSEVSKLIADAEIVLINKSPILAAQIEQARCLKFISIFATGTDIIDLKAAANRGILVSNAVGYGTPSVVQHVWSLILALTTNLNSYQKAAVDGRWTNSESFCVMDFPVSELKGKTLGIVGAGELGMGVAKIGEAFDMKIIFAALPGRDHSFQSNRIPLDTLLAESDVVSLHCPITQETKHLISHKELQLMKPSCILINTARGALINEDALRMALVDGEISGAAIDVLSTEPPANGNILLDDLIPNLIITPHVAWVARESRQRLLDQVAGNVEAFLLDEARNLVC